MYKLKLTEEAKADLFRIYEYGFHKFGEIQAEKYIDKFYENFEKIEFNPFMFPEAINFNGVDRFCVCGVDKIFYNIVGSEIEIITIIGRQDFP